MANLIPASDEVEVYVSRIGQVCLKSPSFHGEVSIIAVNPHDVQRLIEYLEEARQEALEFVPKDEELEVENA